MIPFYLLYIQQFIQLELLFYSIVLVRSSK